MFCSVCAYVPQPDEKKCKLCGRVAQRCDMCGRTVRNARDTGTAVFCMDCVERETGVVLYPPFRGPAEAI